MTLDLWIICAVGFLILVPLARFTIYRPQFNGIEDVVSFARKLNVEDFERITDPAEEWFLRRSTSRREFRQIQRKKMRLCAEYLSRVSHNGELLQGWGYHDHAISALKTVTPADEKTYLLRQLSETATEVRIFAVVRRMKLKIWLLARADLLPAPLIPTLGPIRKTDGVDLLVAYQRMIDLAKRLSEFYGPDWAERMEAVL